MDWKSSDVAHRYRAAEAMTGPFARHLVEQCGLRHADGTEDIIILDNACGTGIVTVNIYDAVPAAAKPRLSVVCGDFSPSMVESVQARIEQSGWTNATTKVLDAQKLDIPDAHFTHVLTSFAIVGIPDPYAALAEIRRVLRPAGTCALTIWKSVGWYPYTAAALDRIPGAPPLMSFANFSTSFLKPELRSRHGEGGAARWVEPAFFEERIREAGFVDVRTELHANETRYATAEEYVQTFAGMTKMVAGNIWTEEERALIMPRFDQALLEVLKEHFGEREIVLKWEAYCVTAKVPVLAAAKV